MIIFFTGPSASGKDCIYKLFSEKYGFDRVILHTTRPQRDGEVDGISYYFITSEEMDELEKNQQLIERRDYQTVFGVWSYATSSSVIDLSRNQVVVGSLEMLDSFILYYGKENVIPFFIYVDDMTRLERAVARARKNMEEPNEVARRFLSDSRDFSEKKLMQFDIIVIDNNGPIENTMEQIDNYMESLQICSAKPFVKSKEPSL